MMRTGLCYRQFGIIRGRGLVCMHKVPWSAVYKLLAIEAARLKGKGT